ncbi:MAG: hypothetical protein M3Q44_00695 [bacterium]|nr:hypothetical protein [bacterium]
MDAYVEIVKSIIKSQMAIIGPMAVDEANKIEGLTIDNKLEKIAVTGGNPEKTIKQLIEQCALLFGSISIEVSNEAITSVVKNKQLNINVPTLLQ